MNQLQAKKGLNPPNLALVPYSVSPLPLWPLFGITDRISADGFEIDISYPEEFKNVPLDEIIPTPLPHLHVEREPVKIHDPEYWKPWYPPEEKKLAKRSLEKRGPVEFLWRNKFAILTGAALYAGGTWLWNWWKTRKAERAAEKSVLEAVKAINGTETRRA
jgi:hypothetical protein